MSIINQMLWILIFQNTGTFGFKGVALKSLSMQIFSQPAFTCSKLTIETLEQGVKYIQS